MLIHELEAVDSIVLTGLERLLRQLSPNAPALTEERLAAIIKSDSSRLLVAVENGEILACLTLVLFAIPSGLRARVEDVIVDEKVRGKGIGAALNASALKIARQAGARTVDLTTRPGRTAAIELYKKLGYRRRDTNVFRIELDR